VVEDEPIAAQAHCTFVSRVPGFEVAGSASTAAEALRFLASQPVDLILLDLNLPDRHGLDICRQLRMAAVPIDVIAVTSARDLAVVRASISLGVVQYLLKPFTFATLRDKLLRYAEYQQQITAGQSARGQSEVDRALATLRGVDTVTLPKGLSPETLDLVVEVLRRQPGRSSASEVAAQLGLNRVTARRYLEYLAEQGQTVRASRHGAGAGRPEVEYGWTAAERRPPRSGDRP